MRATEREMQILDHSDRLLGAMAEAVESGDGDAFLDALEESQAADRRLSESREYTWAVWFSQRATGRGVAA